MDHLPPRCRRFAAAVASARALCAAAALLLAPAAGADLPLVADDEIPATLSRVEGDGIHVFTRVALEQHEFQGFSLGGSDDLPAVEAQRLRALVAGLGPLQWVFVQATADTTRWQGQQKKDNHRLDVSVAIARTLWGLDRLERKRVSTLPPRLAARERELVVSVATYEEKVIPFPAPAAPPPVPVAAPAPAPIAAEEVAAPAPFAIGIEAGMALLSVADITMTTPTVGLVIEKVNARLDLGAGWSPAGDDALGELANANAQVAVSWFPRGGCCGPFLGWVAGSQFVRDVSEYVAFAHGPALGGIARAHYWILDGSLRAGYARVDLDELDEERDWSNAFVFNLQAGVVF